MVLKGDCLQSEAFYRHSYYIGRNRTPGTLSIINLAIQLTTPLFLRKPCKLFASVARVCQRQLGFLGSSFHELMQSRGVRRPSVCLSVCLSFCKLFCANRIFYHRSGWIATKLTHDGPRKGLHPGCAQGHGQGQRSRDTGTFVMSRNVCYTVRSHVLSLHALTL